jgi:hypothetical protein
VSESWGCEFFDDGIFGRQKPKQVQRINHDFMYIPIEIVEWATDPVYLSEISLLDEDIIQDLVNSIGSIGFLEPGKIVISSERIRLQDGNHRFLAAQRLGIKSFPIEIVATDAHIKTKSKKLSEFTKLVMEKIWQAQS